MVNYSESKRLARKRHHWSTTLLSWIQRALTPLIDPLTQSLNLSYRRWCDLTSYEATTVGLCVQGNSVRNKNLELLNC
jgi:hypothetical protein